MGSIAIILFLLFVTTANFALGFAAAVQWGWGAKSWPPWPAFDQLFGSLRQYAQAGAASKPAQNTERDPQVAPLPRMEALALVAPETPAPVVVQTAAAATPAAHEGTSPTSTAAQLLQLAQGFDRCEAELADWDARRREARDDANVANAAVELKLLASGYLGQFQVFLQPFLALPADQPNLVEARDELQAASDALAQQLQAIGDDLSSLELISGDGGSGAERLTTALTQLLAVLHAVRDRTEDPLAVLLHAELASGELLPTLLEHAQLSLLGRLCFDHLFDKTLSDGSVGLFDVDALRPLNAAQGPGVARRALQALSEIARAALPPEVVLARLAGKQFVVCLPDCGAAAATEHVERVRQSIEHVTMTHADREVRLTTSAAVVAKRTGESVEGMLARLRATMQEAKTYGRNRTFLCEAETPSPVAPLKLEIAERAIAL